MNREKLLIHSRLKTADRLQTTILETTFERLALPYDLKDALKGLEQLAIHVIQFSKTEENSAWKGVAHTLDNCHSDLQLWQYDVSVSIPVPTKSSEDSERQGRDIDLSAYDVLEILDAQSNSVCEEISQEISVELYGLERALAGLRDFFAEASSIADPVNHGK